MMLMDVVISEAICDLVSQQVNTVENTGLEQIISFRDLNTDQSLQRRYCECSPPEVAPP